MPLYQLIQLVELEDDIEAVHTSDGVMDHLSARAEVIEHRWIRDSLSERQAALVGVEWAGQ